MLNTVDGRRQPVPGSLDVRGEQTMLSGPPLVLIADDDAEVRAFLQVALQSLGLQVEMTADGLECLASISEATDLVILDVDMPRLDGWETAAAIREDPRWTDLPVLILTGRDTRSDRLRAVEAGASDFIGKPTDVTELRVRVGSLLRLRQAQLLNRRHQAELEEMVARRTTELVKARDEALTASRAKSAFLSRMSHELRTPLNGMLGFTDLLGEEAEERQDTDAVDLLSRIGGAAARLERLVEDVLEFTQVEAGRSSLNIESFPLLDLLTDVVREYEPIAAGNGNVIHLDVAGEGDYLVTDRRRLQRALRHLVDNACRFTTRGAITVSAAVVPVGGLPCLELSVRDSGSGMTPEQMARAFQPFWQADETDTREHQGAGLGLSVSRRHSELLGGSLSGTSEPGSGCNFTIRVPSQLLTIGASVAVAGIGEPLGSSCCG